MNRGIISPWYQRTVDEHRGELFGQLKKGDLLEFERDTFCHWAVFMGEFETIDQENCLFSSPMVAHKSNPIYNGAVNTVSASTRSERGRSPGGVLGGVGSVCIEPLDDVWKHSRMRLNNSVDNTTPPFDAQTIVDRAMDVVNGRIRSTSYDILNSNCEHFATYVRSGNGVSEQINRIKGNCIIF